MRDACPIQTANTTLFDFGIFLDALQSGVVETKDFPQKFFYCFWWGLQNLRYRPLGLKVLEWFACRYLGIELCIVSFSAIPT